MLCDVNIRQGYRGHTMFVTTLHVKFFSSCFYRIKQFCSGEEVKKFEMFTKKMTERQQTMSEQKSSLNSSDELNS